MPNSLVSGLYEHPLVPSIVVGGVIYFGVKWYKQRNWKKPLIVFIVVGIFGTLVVYGIAAR